MTAHFSVPQGWRHVGAIFIRNAGQRSRLLGAAYNRKSLNIEKAAEYVEITNRGSGQNTIGHQCRVPDQRFGRWLHDN